MPVRWVGCRKHTQHTRMEREGGMVRKNPKKLRRDLNVQQKDIPHVAARQSFLINAKRKKGIDLTSSECSFRFTKIRQYSGRDE